MQHRISSMGQARLALPAAVFVASLAALATLASGCGVEPSPPGPPPSQGFDIRGVVRRGGESLENVAVLVGAGLAYDTADGLVGDPSTHVLPHAGGRPDVIGDRPREALRHSGPGGYFIYPHVNIAPTTRQYDIAIRDDSDGVPSFTHFLGLVLNDRQFTVAGESPRKAWSCHVRVHWSDLPPGAKAFYIASGSVIALDDDDDGGGFDLVWNGRYDADIKVHAIVYREDPATKLPRVYLGHANYAFHALGDRDVDWNATPEPLTLSTQEIVLSPRDRVRASVFVDTGDGSNPREIARLSGASGRVVLPRFEDARYTLRAERAGGGATSTIVRPFPPSATRLEAAFPTPAGFLGHLPADTIIARDHWFRWTGEGVARLRVDAGRLGRIDVLTDRAMARIPFDALATLGGDLPPHTPIDVSLLRVPDYGNVNVATDAQGFAPRDHDASESFPLRLVLQ